MLLSYYEIEIKIETNMQKRYIYTSCSKGDCGSNGVEKMCGW